MRKADLILCSDIHLREDTPVCRTDDFQASQWSKLRFLKKLQKKHGCDVLHGGDLFHHWKPSPYLLAKTIKNLPKQFFTVYGQHDLPQHSFELRNKSGIYALEAAGSLKVLWGCHWGDNPPPALVSPHGVLVWHKFVWDGKKVPWPGCNEMTALDILEKYPDYDLIVTGDHHKPFVKKLDGRLLVNPGCFTRQAADYANHQPRVYLYYSDTNSVEPVYLPCAGSEVISIEHLEEAKERNRSLEAFIRRLSDDWEIGLSFEDNMMRFLKNNPVRKDVSSIIYKALEHEKV